VKEGRRLVPPQIRYERPWSSGTIGVDVKSKKRRGVLTIYLTRGSPKGTIDKIYEQRRRSVRKTGVEAEKAPVGKGKITV